MSHVESILRLLKMMNFSQLCVCLSEGASMHNMNLFFPRSKFLKQYLLSSFDDNSCFFNVIFTIYCTLELWRSAITVWDLLSLAQLVSLHPCNPVTLPYWHQIVCAYWNTIKNYLIQLEGHFSCIHFKKSQLYSLIFICHSSIQPGKPKEFWRKGNIIY